MNQLSLLPVTLDQVLVTELLQCRPSRRPDPKALDRALLRLTHQMAESPHQVLQRLAEAAMELCRAGTAGICILERGVARDVFRWHAVAGQLALRSLVGQTLSRYNSPCGMVLDRQTPMLFAEPERYFPLPVPRDLPIQEVLVTPFRAEGQGAGTIWIISHDAERKFSSTDLHIVTELGRFASSAYGLLTSLGYAQGRPN